MADIPKGAIKLMASQVLADTDDGGGQMTSNEIVSGNVNNLFPDISRLDRTYGRVSMRKGYPSIQTDNRATYYGSHLALIQQAKDPLVNVTVFTTEDWFDTRQSCQKRIEGYLVKGPLYPCALWGDHYAGSKAITVFTEKNWPIPETGEVFVIIRTRDLNNALVPKTEQFLRVTKVTSEIREFDDGQNKYQKQIITLTFGTKIEHDLKGNNPSRAFTYSEGRGTVLYSSVAADTSKYFGVSELKEPAVKGQLSLRVDEVRKQLVPSTTSQAAVTDFTIGNLREAAVSASGEKIEISRSISYTSGNTNEILVGIGITRGSVECTIPSLGTFTDNGKGDLLDSSNLIAGTVDYLAGVITYSSNSSGTAVASIKIIPAVSLNSFTESGSIAIQEQNRGYVYVFNCDPPPAPGTLRIDYLSSGKWYSLYDLGTGELKGTEDGIGSGMVNLETGSLSMTLGGMPDIGSMILIFWGTHIYSISLSEWSAFTDEIHRLWGTAFTFPPVQIEKEVNEVDEGQLVEFSFPITSGTYRVYGEYYSEGNDLHYEYIDAENNILSGKCGYCEKNENGAAKFIFTVPDIPENVTSYTLNFVQRTEEEVTVSSSYADVLTLNLGTINPIKERSIKGKIRVLPEEISKASNYTYVNPEVAGMHNISGANIALKQHFLDIEFYDVGGKLYRQGTGEEIGTVNYSAGNATINGSYVAYLNANKTVQSDYQRNSFYTQKTKNTNKIILVEQTCKYEANSDIVFKFQSTTTTPQDISEEVSDFSASVFIPKPNGTVFAAGSLTFKYKNNIFLDNGLGKAISPTTDQVYTIEYATGKIIPENTLDPFALTSLSFFQLKGVCQVARKEIVYHWVFRTPGAPITPSSFTIQAVNDNDGTVITANGDFDGNIESSSIHGFIDYSTGVGSVGFGVWKPIPSGEETAAWLDDYETDGSGNYLEPISVQTDTIVMNCVVETRMSLDADLLGLNPVKLPLDGKVPVFRDDDIILIHHSQTDIIASPTAGQTVALSRQNVKLIELYDNDGVYIPEVGNYSSDLTAGTITFEDPLDLSIYSAPFHAINRIEDMVLATDVQITGHITVSQPLSYDYPAEETAVSSVLPIGDIQARIYNVFTDSSWGDIWSDSRRYGPTSAQYDTVNYPIITKNKSSVKTRFACVFTSSNTVNVLSEHLGVILTNAPITADIAPINPATGEEYFLLRHEGWGAGWSAGQVLRFNSDAGNFPVWFCRTTQQGPATENSDSYVIQIRGDSS